MPESSRYQWIPARLRRLALIPLAAIGVVLGLLVAPGQPTASAAVLFGHDISWPQCPSTVPPTSTQFVVIGLTNGLPFTENPCLASQAGWATALAKPTHAYTMAGFPTAAQLTAYASSGPWSASSRAGRLSNVGYAEATYAAASIRRVAGWQPRMVWIDVEPRDTEPRRQPWPSSTAAQRQENRYVIEGIMRGLRAAGFSYGLYANATGWQSITGSWWLPGVPVWATAGRLDYPTEALDRCTQPSFSGGKVYLAQWWDDVWDYDRTCGTYDFGALPMPTSNLSASTGDFNGDWRGDIVARWTSGALKLYAGDGNGSHAAGATIGTNWSAYSTLETVGDLSGDGSPDVVVRQRANGYLWMFRGTGKGAFIAPAVLLGTGWNVMNAIVGPGDLNGDQRVDLLARQASNGDLFLYRGNGRGGLGARVRIATGWNRYDLLVPVGDVSNDGRPDLMARERSTAYLWLFAGNGSGGFAAPTRVGAGWNQFTALMSPGDFTGDRVGDVLARKATGQLYLYPRTPTNGWSTPRLVSTGWNIANALF